MGLHTFTIRTTRPTTTKVEHTVTIQVRKVIVETWHPNGRALSSHRSDHNGQISGLKMGARICILAVLGMHVEDCAGQYRKWLALYRVTRLTVGHQLHGFSSRHPEQFWCFQHRLSRSSNVPFPKFCFTTDILISQAAAGGKDSASLNL
jgi:hypothetical protein